MTEQKKPQKSVAIFVDVQNIYYTCRQKYGRSFDYNALWALATENKQVVKAFAYAIDSGNEKQRQFQNILRAIGFEVKLKPYIQRKDGSAKGDWDVGITLDAIEYGAQADKVILLSGDGDFDLLVTKLRTKHKCEVTVVGVEELTATSLLIACDDFIGIDDNLLL
ncbi:NYN domain-containing protein [Thalassomonas sp. M1454]|uniref:LabA-like NYN domain-containing protein n=1 Tax=Thalassomonas sp. M1454 TaxID=2594477 RepID=UPI00117E0B8A|nr:NYN domain-containing protein [Thalassomonas sp. M1454]TRX54944.1 NYN domain-containing protein [Thalassomonas sp. M1454]